MRFFYFFSESIFKTYFGVPEPRIELGTGLQQHDGLPVGFVATLVGYMATLMWAMSPPYVGYIATLVGYIAPLMWATLPPYVGYVATLRGLRCHPKWATLPPLWAMLPP